MYLRGSDDYADADFDGQVNGLCGASAGGVACLRTGTHTGNIDLRVELHDAAPAIDTQWQEVVEVTFAPWVTPVTLMGLMGDSAVNLDLACVDYRMRYSASGMDEAHGTPTQREAVAERYRLQFWPAPPARDCVLRETSSTAAYWHRNVQRALKTPEELEKELQEELQEQQRTSHGQILTSFAPGLPDLIMAADAEMQRSIARRVVHRACELAGVASIDWIVPALAAMDRGQPLPDPFGDKTAVTARVLDDARIPKMPSHWCVDDKHVAHSQQEVAIQAVFAAVQADPAQAAIDAVSIAVLSCDDSEQIVAEVRGWLVQ
jgi:hypothetical protein